MKICILIPVHNESQHIAEVIRSLQSRNLDIIVINDGSTDGSGDIAQKEGAVVLSHAGKKGKGVSLQQGFEYALQHHYDGIVTMDGDGQHDAADLTDMLASAEEHPASIVTGNRMKNNKDMPLVRLLTNKIMSKLISIICKQSIPDTQCGYRYIGSQILKSIQLTSSDFEIETEVLVQASKMGCRIYSVPVKTIYRNEDSKINPFTDTVKFFIYIGKELFQTKSRKKSPRS